MLALAFSLPYAMPRLHGSDSCRDMLDECQGITVLRQHGASRTSTGPLWGLPVQTPRESVIASLGAWQICVTPSGQKARKKSRASHTTINSQGNQGRPKRVDTLAAHCACMTVFCSMCAGKPRRS